MNQCIVAIDPGASGGLAVKHGNAKIYAAKMPETEGDILTQFREISLTVDRNNGDPVAFVEDQTGYAGVQVSAPAMFRFGRNFGFLLGALMATHWRVELVKPQKWQKALSLGNRVSYPSRTEWKNHLKSCAQRLYPEINVTLATADALLILEYATHRDQWLDAP